MIILKFLPYSRSGIQKRVEVKKLIGLEFFSLTFVSLCLS